MTYRTDQIT